MGICVGLRAGIGVGRGRMGLGMFGNGVRGVCRLLVRRRGRPVSSNRFWLNNFVLFPSVVRYSQEYHKASSSTHPQS